MSRRESCRRLAGVLPVSCRCRAGVSPESCQSLARVSLGTFPGLSGVLPGFCWLQIDQRAMAQRQQSLPFFTLRIHEVVHVVVVVVVVVEKKK